MFMALTSMGKAPTDWMASTQSSTPLLLQYWPRVARSVRKPLANWTEEMATSRVRELTASISLSSGIRPSSSSTMLTCTPRGWRACQG